MNYVIALFLGTFFGFALNKAGLTRYNKIVNQFRFTDMAVLKFMMTALVVAMIGLYGLRGLGLVTFPAVPSTYIRWKPGRRIDLRGRHGPDRILTRYLCRRVRRRKTRLFDPWIAWISDRRRNLRTYVSAGVPANLQDGQLR